MKVKEQGKADGAEKMEYEDQGKDNGAEKMEYGAEGVYRKLGEDGDAEKIRA